MLWRAFFHQFFTSENVSSDEHLRRTIIWALAFLLVPGIILLVQLFFDYAGVAARAIHRQQFDRLEDMLLWIEFVFVTYSMVTLGFVAVFVWDALAFDRRDAMVLGPLPLGRGTIVLAKLAALGAFVAGASATVNLPDALVFAFETGDQFGLATVGRHFIAHLTATVMAATFVFAVIVAIRGATTVLAGPRVEAAVAAFLQFAFCFALLSCVVLCPAVWRLPRPSLVNNTVTHWLPSAWFTGIFEWLRGSSRWYVRPLAARAVAGLLLAVAAAVAASIAACRRHLHRTVVRPPVLSSGGGLRVARAVARTLAGRDRVAAATADFVLLTIARSAAARLLVMMNMAVAAAVVLAVISSVSDLGSLFRPRVEVLSIPLVFAYWTTVGLRAAFFEPAELPAAWAFRATAPPCGSSYWAGVFAGMAAIVVPAGVAVSVLATAPILGWTVALCHAVVVGEVSTVVVQAAALLVDFVPFTRAYQPGRANLKTRWWLYAIGLWVSAYIPARAEARALDEPMLLLALIAALGALIAVLHRIGGARAARWRPPSPDERADPLAAIRVLDLSGVAQKA